MGVVEVVKELEVSRAVLLVAQRFEELEKDVLVQYCVVQVGLVEVSMGKRGTWVIREKAIGMLFFCSAVCTP